MLPKLGQGLGGVAASLAAQLLANALLAPAIQHYVPGNWVRGADGWTSPGTFRVGGNTSFELIAFNQTVFIPDVQNPSFVQVRYYTVAPLPYPPVLGWFMAKPGFDRYRGQGPLQAYPKSELYAFGQPSPWARPDYVSRYVPYNRPEQWSPPKQRPVVGVAPAWGVDVISVPGRPPVVRPVLNPVGRPPKGVVETKMNSRRMAAPLMGLINGLTESLDVWNAALKAVGWQGRRKKVFEPGYAFDSMFADQWSYMVTEGHWADLSDQWKQLLANLARNEVEDRLFGGLSNALKSKYGDLGRYGMRPDFGLQLGPVM